MQISAKLESWCKQGVFLFFSFIAFLIIVSWDCSCPDDNKCESLKNENSNKTSIPIVIQFRSGEKLAKLAALRRPSRFRSSVCVFNLIFSHTASFTPFAVNHAARRRVNEWERKRKSEREREARCQKREKAKTNISFIGYNSDSTTNFREIGA